MPDEPLPREVEMCDGSRHNRSGYWQLEALPSLEDHLAHQVSDALLLLDAEAL